MKRAVFAGIMLFFSGGIVGAPLPGTALGGPAEGENMSGKFAAADTNKDGFLDKEEFAAAFPALKSEAFTLIDKDGDGRVSAAEWGSLSMGHGGSRDFPGGGRSVPDGESLPLEPVPQGQRK